MGGSRILDDAQLEEMCALREKGWGIDRIAQHFTENGTEISANAINWQCMRLGADAPAHLRGKHTQTSQPYERNGYLVRPYTADEDERLIAMSIAGLKDAEIGRELGRKSNSIRGRLMTLARREARQEER